MGAVFITMTGILAVWSFWCKVRLIWEANNISLSLSTVHLGANFIYATIIYKQQAILISFSGLIICWGVGNEYLEEDKHVPKATHFTLTERLVLHLKKCKLWLTKGPGIKPA